MMSLHQLRCFLATYELGSLTAAAEHLGYAQPSISEQIRTLEKSIDAKLFRRVGRGVVPTTVADSLRPHAERVLAAVDEARQAVQQARSLETGTIRFGMFGTARLYAGAGLVAGEEEAEEGGEGGAGEEDADRHPPPQPGREELAELGADRGDHRFAPSRPVTASHSTGAAWASLRLVPSVSSKKSASRSARRGSRP